MPANKTSQDDATRVALVLDAGGARSAYQVGALEVLLPALAERGTRPRVLVGTSAGALLAGALCGTAHLETDDQIARLKTMLGQTTKQNVMRPLWKQMPEVLARYTSETLGLSHFRLRGLFGSQPLAQTLARSIDWEALHRNVEHGAIESAAVTATSVRTGRVTMFTESRSPLPRSAPEYHGRFVATRLDVPHLMASAAIPVLFPSVHVDEPAEAAVRRQVLHDVDPPADRTDGQASSDHLAEAGDVGAHVVLRLGAARTDPESGDDLVEDQQCTDPIAFRRGDRRGTRRRERPRPCWRRSARR